MTQGIMVGSSRGLSVKLTTPWKGTWFADCDLDPDDPTSPPTGAVTIQIGDSITLQGTIDPSASGRFVSTYRARVVGGGGGWDRGVSPQDFANDAGVKSTEVYTTTAGQIGETVNDPTPVTFQAYFVRSAGAASRVFGDRDWYVDAAGMTWVQSRPAASADASLEILGFDPSAMRAEVSCDALILPGTTLTDPRFDGTYTVRDVMQSFTRDGGSRADLYFSAGNISRLASALVSMVREMSGRAYLRTYRYRYISTSGTGPSARLNLQAVDKNLGLPDILPVPIMPGIPGMYASLAPAQIVLVAFPAGDPSDPVVVSFDGNVPMTVTLDASGQITFAPNTGNVAPVARLGDAVSVFFPPEIPFTGTVGGVPATGTLTIIQAAPGTIQAGSGRVSSG